MGEEKNNEVNDTAQEKFNKLDDATQEMILDMLNDVCEEITLKTGMAGGRYIKKSMQLEKEMDSFNELIRKDNNLELENKMVSILDQFINILKDCKEELKK